MVECYICKQYIKPEEGVSVITKGTDKYVIHEKCDRRREKTYRPLDPKTGH